MLISNEELYDNFRRYINNLKKLIEKNPELVKKMSYDSLVKTGIISKDRDLRPPYNGEEVNHNDFTIGPSEIDYSKPLKKVKTNVKNKK